MTKQAWQDHMTAEGFIHTVPPTPEGKIAKATALEHMRGCAVCEARRKTTRRARRVAEREEALRSCGLVKVRGALGGIYWE